MNYKFEENKLFAYLGEDIIDALIRHEAYVAGGAITSLMTNSEINDVDIYFRNKESAVNFIEEIWDDGNGWVVSHTNKATAITHDDITIQLIHFDYFESPKEIFDKFDYTVCMGCYDFKTKEFILHNDFLKHNSQRLLKYNHKTAFPIISLLRVQKYNNKGYSISKPEMIRIILSCMNLGINTYEELKEQMGGMYGVNYGKLFIDVDMNDGFDLQLIIDRIADLAYDEDYFKEIKSKDIKLETIVTTILGSDLDYIEINNNEFYMVCKDDTLRNIYSEPVNGNKLDASILNGKKIYKVVSKKDGGYFSKYDSDFEYKIGEYTKPNGDDYLYFNELKEINYSTYSKYLRNESTEHTVIEATITDKDFHCKNDGYKTVLVKGCTVIREVPREEYEMYL